MAFRQPQQRPAPARQVSFSTPAVTTEAVAPSSPQRSRRPVLEESQEWILFSPDCAVQSQGSQSQTSHTPRTTNFSRASDFGSLETGVRSDQIGERDDQDDDGNLTCQGTEIEDEDEAELDSLDDGLHAFHAPSSPRLIYQSGETVLPMHDGLGTFPSSYNHAAEGMQEQLWQFERFNPHRRRARRRSSVQKRLDAMEEEEHSRGLDKAEERRLRIEKWRMEQSKAVLEEIERETRRRQRRMSRMSGVPSERAVSGATDSGTGVPRQQSVAEPTAGLKAGEKEETESFWQRITRRVIRDLIGLDDSTLSVIFGEELPSELSATPTQASPLGVRTEQSSPTTHPGMAWERRLLERIARELGILVHEIFEHDGAFSTYARAGHIQPSAALPTTLPKPTPARTIPLPAQSSAGSRYQSANLAASEALFAPTLQPNLTATDASLWGIEEEPLTTMTQPITAQTTADATQQDAEYWQRDLDINTIFTYLRNRFSSRPYSPAQNPPSAALQPQRPNAASTQTLGPLPASWTTDPTNPTNPTNPIKPSASAAHHPLVSRAAERSAQRRRESILRRHQNYLLSTTGNHLAAAVAAGRVRSSSSCASQSTKRSRRSASAGSRKFWDFPGGSGSAVSAVSVGASDAGGWGEV
ncbi:hypothetical protein H2203_003338 [Taxawa tesnikishii (nom. ined.)]|nr:hypothetical protein H2203_003338 [Dothideales sp. JES 119]